MKTDRHLSRLRAPELGLGLGLGLTRPAGGGGAAPATFTMPDNWDFLVFGDSRSTLGGNNPSVAIGSGTYIYSNPLGGLDFWLPSMTQQRMRTGYNFSYGIGGQGVGPDATSDMLTIPRPTTATLGLDYVAANPSSNIIWLAGVNNGLLASSANTFNAIAAAFASLTDPTVAYAPYGGVLPLYNGRPKNIIVLNELPGGKTKTGTGPTSYYLTQPQIDALAALSAQYDKYDYASGDALANPRIKVIDVFEDPTIYDVSTTTLRRNIVGIHVDDVHPMPYGMYRIATKVASWVNALSGAGAPTTRYNLATSATASTFCNANPLGTGTGGTFTGTGTHTGTMPTGWALNCPDALNVDVTTALDGTTGANVITLHVTGTNAVDAALLRIRQTTFNNRTVGSAGDIYRTCVKLGYTLTSGVLQQTLLSLQTTWSNANYTQQITAGNKPSLYGGQTRYLNENLNINQTDLIIQSGALDLSNATYSGLTLSGTNFDLNFQLSTGTIDMTFTITQLGFSKTGS